MRSGCRGIDCFTVKKNVKPGGVRRRPEPSDARLAADNSADQRAPRRGAGGPAPGPRCRSRRRGGLQVLVDDFALERAHRLERDRAAVVDRGLGGLVGGRAQGHRPALAVARGVDDDALAARRPAKGDAVGQMLDRVDRLAVMADQQPEIVADELGRDTPPSSSSTSTVASTPASSAIRSINSLHAARAASRHPAAATPTAGARSASSSCAARAGRRAPRRARCRRRHRLGLARPPAA